ncbi:MAG TPA: ComEC/Rec2 family competence protein, partial [Candidatus Saccharibacteria bacterium]|nr:ComEC/Rec2 family competence protein [Candidatus Saccharibacteria bacterium]
VRLQLATQKPIARGDSVTVKGKFQEGFGTLAGAMYRPALIDAKRPNPGDIGRRVRDWFAGALRSVVDEPQASLGLGFLLGQKSALPDDLADAMRIAGLTHIVVASGYNLTILVRFARRLFLKISRFAAAITASLMVLSFMAITGMSPSMSRAGLVAGLSLGAWYVGRRFHPVILLSIAAGMTVLVQPSYAWGDVGWQLSFAAFAGVMLLAPMLQNYFFGSEKPGALRQLLGETISAHLVTLPIILVTFGQLSHIAIIANMIVVPLVPLAMLATFIVGGMSLLWQPAAELLSIPLEWLLGYMVNVAMFLSELPWATSEIALPSWVAVLAYAGMVIIGVWLWRASKTNLRQTSILEYISGAACWQPRRLH